MLIRALLFENYANKMIRLIRSFNKFYIFIHCIIPPKYK